MAPKKHILSGSKNERELIGSMGSPYLNSGETIILTTNRVVVDAIAYDVMLTTARIFFTDNRNPRFEPAESPLSAILSVQGGKTPANDPVITIRFRPEKGGGDVRQPLNLVFSQNPGENRKPERDEWVRTIIQVSIALQDKRIAAEASPVPEPTGDRGLQPAVRRWVAPDRVRPLSNMGHPQRAMPAATVVIPDEVEGGGEIPVRATEPPEKAGETAVPEHEPAPGPDSGTATGYTPVPVQREPPAIRARVIIPQIRSRSAPTFRISSSAPQDSQERRKPLRTSSSAHFRNSNRFPTISRSGPAMEPAPPAASSCPR